MYLKKSKKIIIKIGSSLLIDNEKNIREKWLIEFSKDNYGQHIDNVDALGYAQVDFSKSRHQWAYIMIYTEAVEKGTKISLCIGCDSKQEMDMTTKQEMLEMDSDAIKKVLIHELGHGLGIGHYVQDLRTDNNIESLMYPNFNPFSNKNEIEEIPLAAFLP